MSADIKYWKEVIHSKVGTGDTAKKAMMENYWQAEALEDGTYKMTLLDNSYESTGYAEMVSAAELNNRFSPLEEFNPKPKSQQETKSDQIAARAERHLAKNELNSAEFEFHNALKLNESNVRANFGLGKTYLAMGDEEKAKERFVKLSTIEEVLEPDNKHLFNELGMQMRKMGLFQEATAHYKRALELTEDDENLWFNQARCYFEADDLKNAVEALRKALTLNSNFDDAKQFLLYIKQQTENKAAGKAAG